MGTTLIRALGAMFIVLTLNAFAQTVTPNTKCGKPATGYRYGTTDPITLDADGAKFMQVGPDKVWRFCSPEAKTTAPPKDCSVPRPLAWGEADRTCSAVYLAATVRHGATAVARTAPGALDGLIVLQCSDGALSVRVSTCDQTTACIGSYTGSDDGGRTQWTWTGQLPEGSRGVAVSGGKTRPIECLGGQLRLR